MKGIVFLLEDDTSITGLVKVALEEYSLGKTPSHGYGRNELNNLIFKYAK